MNQSAKGKNEMKSLATDKSKNNINLPRLDRIVIKGSNPRNSIHAPIP